MGLGVIVNFDALIGPTHNYAGLGEGNLASINNSNNISYPKNAALQGIEKMWDIQNSCHDANTIQAVLPPQDMPNIHFLRELGFAGTFEKVMKDVIEKAPEYLIEIYSASSMWAANWATITSSANSVDGKINITPANMITNVHRSMEARKNELMLKQIFSNKDLFTVHPRLPQCLDFADEGAANHMYIGNVDVFVYGKGKGVKKTSKFLSRQGKRASECLSLKSKDNILVCQNPKIIDQGVFHNDVIATSHGNKLLLHEEAYVDQKKFLKKLKNKVTDLKVYEVSSKQMSVKQSVKSYLFNSQIVDDYMGMQWLIAPIECSENVYAQKVIEDMLAKRFIYRVKYVDVRQSMSNGGGPACLRLRMPINQEERLHILKKGIILDYRLYSELKEWVNKHYRDELHPKDLLDINLANECSTALHELTQILKLQVIF